MKISGKRTYIIAALIGVATAAHALNLINSEMWITLMGLLNGGGLAALRSGVNK